MSLFDYFKPVPTWSVEKVKAFLHSHRPGEFNLLDVRQPEEYFRGHIPGARLAPIKDLFDLKAVLEPHLPTIVYCRAGIRSRAACSILTRAGFRLVISIEGGFKAWHGQLASGLPEMAVTWFLPAETPEQFVALAWYLEEGTRQFYTQAAGLVPSPEVRKFFDDLTRDEGRHQAALRELYERFAGHTAGEEFPFGIVDLPQTDPVMEGVVVLSQAIQWARGRSEREIMELTMAIEAVAYDRYLFMLQRLHGKEAQRVFRLLVAAEKLHLEKVTKWYGELALEE